MKPVELTRHIIERVWTRMNIDWHKVEQFIRNKFKVMMESPDARIKKSEGKVYKVIVGDEKIVYEYYSNRYKLITYAKRSEYDRIEKNLLDIIRYHDKKFNKNWR